MAGHSKWANIKHRKARQDSKRQKVYGKLIREITIAARLGGGNPEDNPRLRTVLFKATGANIPKDTIERAISRGASGLEGGNLEELNFEGYGPSGVAILVEAVTDNRNRTVSRDPTCLYQVRRQPGYGRLRLLPVPAPGSCSICTGR